MKPERLLAARDELDAELRRLAAIVALGAHGMTRRQLELAKSKRERLERQRDAVQRQIEAAEARSEKA